MSPESLFKKTVLVVGAGCSRMEALTLEDKRERRPPLDTDFFQLCRNHSVEVHLEILRRYLERAYSIEITKRPYPRLEEVFGLVYSDTRLQPLPEGARGAFTILCQIYAKVLLGTTNWIRPSAFGPLALLLGRLHEWGTCTVVTFNQDILIEKALSALNPTKPLWFPDTGYKVHFENYTTGVGTTAAQEKDIRKLFALGNGRESAVHVLKLHGSLNWYTPTRSATDIPSTMRQNAIYRCTRRLSIPEKLTFVYPGGKGRKRWYTWPVMVPPVYEKGPFMRSVLGPVWSDAQRALKAATAIVVYGYSFPSAAQRARSFFRRARASNPNLRCVVVINPNQAAAAEAREVLFPPAMVVASSVLEFLPLWPKAS